MSFFDLPVEVRQRVYSYTFGHGVAAAVSRGNQDDVVVAFRPNERSAQLLCMSRVIHNEASAIFLDQTNISLARDFSHIDYLSNENADILGPKSDSIRHLKIDFHPNELGDIDLHRSRLAYYDLSNVKDITLSCFDPHWSPKFPAGFDDDDFYSYDETVLLLRTLAVALLVNTSLNVMEEKTIPGKEVVIELSTDKAKLQDRNVSQ